MKLNSSRLNIVYSQCGPEQLSLYSDGLWAGWSEFESQQEQDFYLLHDAQTDSVAHHALYPMVTRPVSQGVRRQEREADHSLVSYEDIKNGGS
jgi:hypothetical protein